MPAFATFAELKARYPSVTDVQQARVEALLEDASSLVSRELSDAGIAVDGSDEGQASALRAVTCAVAMRAMPAFGTDGYAPIKSYQETIGPFAGNVTLANPTGDMYLTGSERKWLGISARRHCITQLFSGADVLGGGDDG